MSSSVYVKTCKILWICYSKNPIMSNQHPRCLHPNFFWYVVILVWMHDFSDLYLWYTFKGLFYVWSWDCKLNFFNFTVLYHGEYASFGFLKQLCYCRVFLGLFWIFSSTGNVLDCWSMDRASSCLNIIKYFVLFLF